MSIPAKNGGRYRFGPFELDPTAGRLARNGATVKLQDLPYRLLVMLVERPGEIVTREEVRQRLWPENTFVEFDNSLTSLWHGSPDTNRQYVSFLTAA